MRLHTQERLSIFRKGEYVYVASLGFALWVPNVNAAQPQPSIPYRLDVYTPK
jgi:hypothetical protein